jgi:hypothetical protein
MKKKYGIERGSHKTIIKRISDAVTRMDTKIMACKLLRKCRKEEVTVGVVTVAKCVEGTTLSWAPYLLNLFLDDCKDTRDLGTEFHYSWLLILIALLGWKELKYSFFATRPNPCHTTRYLSLGTTLDPKNRNLNAAIFEGYHSNLQERIANTSILTSEVVA